MTFKLFVTYIAKPDCREQFVREVIQNRILQDIRAEKGCLQYEYFFSVDDVNKILISEEWDTAADQKLHCTQPHMDKLREIKSKYIADIKILEIES